MIGRTNTGGGGGGGLNFQVVGGITAPNNPKENMIWINTDQKITSYIFSATEPTSLVEGMVWILTGASSTVEFNALKKNGIQVYPLSAKQYVNGAWVGVTARSYQNVEWASWVKTILPNSDYTWVKASTANVANITHNSDGTVKISAGTTGNEHASARTTTMIDLTPYKTLTVVYNASNNSNALASIGVTTETTVGTSGNAASFNIASYAAGTKVTATLSIENVNTPCYIFAALFNQNVTFYSITLT